MNMELLFATVGGAILGIGEHYLLPHRQLRGSLLLSAVGTAVAAVAWDGLTWLGWRFDATWIWVVSLVLAGAIPLLVGLVIDRRRRDADDRLFAALSKA